MATTSVRSVRGTISLSTRTVNKEFDATVVETVTLELNTGMEFKVVEFFGEDYYYVDGDKVTEEVFHEVLRTGGHDWKMWTKALDKKRQWEDRNYSKDPMGTLADYE